MYVGAPLCPALSAVQRQAIQALLLVGLSILSPYAILASSSYQGSRILYFVAFRFPIVLQHFYYQNRVTAG